LAESQFCVNDRNVKKNVTFSQKPRYNNRVKNFRNFYKLNNDRLFGYFLRMTGDYHLSADLMQDSFTRYFERYKDKDASVSLLFTIGRNLLFDNFRGKESHKSYQEGRHGLENDPEQAFLVREEYRQVLSAMQRLDKIEREMLTLAVTSDLSYREIAKITQTSEANVKIKIHRSRLKLRKFIHVGEI
jgi:RNA polymerase sigma-70 factor (ECF subfamily)